MKLCMLRFLAIFLLALTGCSGPDNPGSSDSIAHVQNKAVVVSTAEVFRFAKISNGAYFFTGSLAERDQVLRFFPDFRYEGVAFLRIEVGSGTPVYRFANLANGGYFYTASAVERDEVIQTRPDLRFEGTTFNVADAQTADVLQVRRLANLFNGAYLFTTSETEVRSAVASGLWRDEGVSFFAPGGQPIPPGPPVCPAGATASGSTCVCTDSGSVYQASTNTCPPVVPPACPPASVPLNGGCVCTGAGLIYQASSNSCVAAPPTVCPSGSVPVSGSCVCGDSRLVFDSVYRTCRTPCPNGSSLSGGTCACSDPNLEFDPSSDLCVPALICPATATRLGRNCICPAGGLYDAGRNVCRAPCPANATPVSGTCSCNVTNFLYDATTNSCVLPPDESSVRPGRPSNCIENVDGCGGGASDGSPGSDGSGDGVGTSDGKLSGALVEVWRPLNGTLKLLGSATVGATSGMVTLQPGTYTGPVWIVVRGQSGGSYFDEATRTARPFEQAEELNALIPSRTTRRNYGVTALTDGAFRYALQRWGNPSLTRQQNIAAILTDARVNEANDFVRNRINAQLTSGTQLDDIIKMPVIVGPNSAANSVPNTSNGIYSIVLASFALTGQSFNAQVIGSQESGSFTVTTNPARDFSRQLALDLTDGVIDGRINGNVVAQPQARVYSTSSTDSSLLGFGMTSIPMLSGMTPASVQAAASLYASPALTQSVTGGQSTGTTRPPGCGTLTIVYPDGSRGCCQNTNTIYNQSGTFYCRAADGSLALPVRF